MQHLCFILITLCFKLSAGHPTATEPLRPHHHSVRSVRLPLHGQRCGRRRRRQRRLPRLRQSDRPLCGQHSDRTAALTAQARRRSERSGHPVAAAAARLQSHLPGDGRQGAHAAPHGRTAQQACAGRVAAAPATAARHSRGARCQGSRPAVVRDCGQCRFVESLRFGSVHR